MSAYLVEPYLPGITSNHLGAKATSALTTSERPRATTPIAARHHDAEASLASAWLMIGTILGCLVTMMSVVLAAATSIP
jgi:hypothetical protein